MLLKSTIDTCEPVPDKAVRKARVASRTVSVWPEDWIEPDLSSTSMTLIPQRGGRPGLFPGARTLRAVGSTFSGPTPPEQLLEVLPLRPRS